MKHFVRSVMDILSRRENIPCTYMIKTCLRSPWDDSRTRMHGTCIKPFTTRASPLTETSGVRQSKILKWPVSGGVVDNGLKRYVFNHSWLFCAIFSVDKKIILGLGHCPYNKPLFIYFFVSLFFGLIFFSR